jgi:S1-C subfamily serine protease
MSAPSVMLSNDRKTMFAEAILFVVRFGFALDHFFAGHHFRHVPKSIFCIVLLTALVASGFGAEPERCVVQIMTFSQQPVWDAPWRFDSVRRSGGSGFVVKGRKIMTNAHVVSWAKQILVRRFQDPQPYLAKVQYIGHDCDLALLEVEDESFFDGLEPLKFGDLPKVRSTVVTYGYPAGGEQISYTRGVVSRIEMQNYVHPGNRSLLAVQTDAAINPGNSGGPVLQEDEVVGVAFQGMPGLENAGFFIPPPVIQHFLRDIEDGRYDGFPVAGIRVVAFQNPAYRQYLKLPGNSAGARVDSLLPVPATERLIRSDDVILRVGAYEVGSDGTVLYEGNRVFATAAFQTAQSGEHLPLRVWREGNEIEISVPMSIYEGDRLLGNQYDVLPRYFIYGGLVFTPLSQDYMRTFGRDFRDSANAEIVYELYYRRQESPQTARPEPVVLASTLAHPANANVKISSRALVDRINGVRIEKLEDVVRALESPTNTHHVIEFLPNRALEALDRKESEAAHAAILTTYGIPKDRRL